MRQLGEFSFIIFKNFHHIHTTCDAATAAFLLAATQYIIFTHNFHYFGLLLRTRVGAGVKINESKENGKILMKPSTFLTHMILLCMRMRIKLSVLG